MHSVVRTNVLIIVIIATVFGADVSPKNEMEMKILNIFTHWRSGDIASLPFILPQLDVINIPPLNGSYAGKGARMTYYFGKMILTGMNNFTVAELQVSLDAMSAAGSLIIPRLDIYSDHYKVEGYALYVYNLKGSGKFNVYLKNIEIIFEIRLASNTNGTNTSVDDLNLNFRIGDVQVDFENSSWPLNKLLNKEGLKIIEDYHENIVTATQTSLIHRLDKYLNAVTPTQLLDMLQNAS